MDILILSTSGWAKYSSAYKILWQPVEDKFMCCVSKSNEAMSDKRCRLDSARCATVSLRLNRVAHGISYVCVQAHRFPTALLHLLA
jgi:hypothetical protein